MRQSLQLRLGQQLTMTPQLQQAIKLLQLSSLDLQAEIQSVLESNLMLEQVDGDDERAGSGEADGDGSEAREASGEPNEGDGTDLAAQLDEFSDHNHEITGGDAASGGDSGAEGGDASASALNEGDTLPDDLPVDSAWEDLYEVSDGATSYSRGEDEEGNSFEQRTASDQSLQDYLLWQMELTPFSPRDRLIALALIDAIDNRGYLSLSIEEIYQGLVGEFEEGDLDVDEVLAVLKRIQRFDPPGIAAREPGECLRLQLEQLPAETPWRCLALDLVSHWLDSLASRDFALLTRQLNATREQLQEAIRLIQRLNPHPGTQHTPETPQYVIPDVFVYRHQNGWRVELNPDNAPRLRINSHYSSLIRRADSSADNVYLKNHLQEARWFLKSLKNRNETLLRVATAIVERQREFFDRGEEHMKPLVLRDIAESMEMHESTISRVTTQKYMHTPRGIYEFKFFFSSHVATSSGGECSSVAIRAMIKKLISAENPRKPLSDNKIAKLLEDEGIQVARRTVAKYREIMAIPSSTDRKQLI